MALCANQVCGYGGTGASLPWKVLYLTPCWTADNPGPVVWAIKAASILLLPPSVLLVWQ